MRRGLIAVALVVAAGAAGAQGPAEMPPEGFSGRQYTDSRGCVFVHADVGGVTRWVPLMTADRTPVCASPDVAEAPVVEPATVEAPVERARPVVVKRVVARPAPAVSTKSASGVPRGYKLAWHDGRLNPNRGPRTAEGDAQMARVLDTSMVPMRPAGD
jgi:hypothetical protein